jgi:hypothetical protein
MVYGDKQESGGMFYLKLGRLGLEFAVFLIGMIVLWDHKENSVGFYDDTNALYYTQKANIVPIWDKNVGWDDEDKDGKFKPNFPFNVTSDPAEFMDKMRCSEIPAHEMCMCLNVTDSWTSVRNCLLQKNTPVSLHQFDHVSLLSMIVLWFGMTCGINWVSAGFQMQSTNMAGTYANFVTIIGWLVVLAAWFIGVGIGFYGTDDSLTFFVLFFVWWITTVIAIVSVHWDRIKIMLPDMITKSDMLKSYFASSEEEMKHTLQHFYDLTSTQQFLFYSNLLVVVPAIAVVIHLMHHWHDKDQMINTIFLLLSLVSIDAFSMHMTTHWESHVGESLTHEQSVQVGTIKMFAWMVNVLTIYLLLTINYPTIIDEALLAYGLFSILILYLLATFVLPDLVREFTHVYTLQALNMRIIGEFMFRSLALVYVWYNLKHELEQNGMKATFP